MRKFLVVTTALAGVLAALAGPSGAAEPIKLQVGGQMKQWFGGVNLRGGNLADQAGTAAPGGKFNKTGMDTQAGITFSGETKTDSGIVVTARVQLDTPANYGPSFSSVQASETSVALAGGFGTVRAGIKEVANHTMHNEAPDVGMTYGGVANWIAPPSGWATLAPFGNGILNNNLWGYTSFAAFTSKQPSISYISPAFKGLTLGASFVPGSGNVGPVNTLTTAHNVWETTLAYTREISGVSLGIDGGYSRGEGPRQTPQTFLATPGYYFTQSFQAYEGGAKISYKGWTLGGSYLGLQENKIPAAVAFTSTTGRTWNAGLSYTKGPWGGSLTYYNERHRGSYLNVGVENFETIMLSGSYEIGPGIISRSTAFGARYEGLNNSNVNKSYGYGLVTGIDLSF